jgi:hypothetical protein
MAQSLVCPGHVALYQRTDAWCLLRAPCDFQVGDLRAMEPFVAEELDSRRGSFRWLERDTMANYEDQLDILYIIILRKHDLFLSWT